MSWVRIGGSKGGQRYHAQAQSRLDKQGAGQEPSQR